jgi:hypothetical protein
MELRVEQPFERMLTGFEPRTVELPGIDWRSLSADLVRFEQAADVCSTGLYDWTVHRVILDAVLFAPLEAPRRQIAARFAPEGCCIDIIELVRSAVSLWQRTRIMSLLIAVECLRLTEGRSPVNPAVATMVRHSDILREARARGADGERMRRVG